MDQRQGHWGIQSGPASQSDCYSHIRDPGCSLNGRRPFRGLIFLHQVPTNRGQRIAMPDHRATKDPSSLLDLLDRATSSWSIGVVIVWIVFGDLDGLFDNPKATHSEHRSYRVYRRFQTSSPAVRLESPCFRSHRFGSFPSSNSPGLNRYITLAEKSVFIPTG
jgi:hypothetical protein